LHLVGTPIQQEANLQKLLSKFPTLNILTYGQLPPFKVRELMYQCDTLCIPSLNEGFGIVNVEGLATGISVVSTLTGGIPEVLPFEKYGWTVPPEDDFALAEMLESCWTNKEERLRRAKAGRKMVEAHFTSQHLQDNFIKCLVEK
jgi:glycosyltransferase involved in cell wall biosynthesis